MLGYEVQIAPLVQRGLLKLQDKVDSARLVFPSGAVPQAGLLWVELGVNGREDRQLVAIPVAEFHTFVKLPLVVVAGPEEMVRGL